MKGILRYHRFTTAVVILIAGIFLLAQCIVSASTKTEIAKSSEFLQYAGSEACISCHKNIYDSHIHTAHYLTSRPATDQYILGSFDFGKNIFAFSKDTMVKLEKRDHSYYPVASLYGVEKLAR